jgi:hypothetical protein
MPETTRTSDSARASGPSERRIRILGIAVRHDDAMRVWDEALCAEVDPELFFPEMGQPARAALELCTSCGVRDLCRETFGPLVSYGVVGGTTARQRRGDRSGRRVREVAA